MSTVLLATDGSDLATAAMLRGVDLLGRNNDFYALTVLNPPFMPAAAVSPMDTHPMVMDPNLEFQIEEQQRVDSEAEMRALNDVLGINAKSLIEMGEPGPTVCRIAASVNADVIVVGSHGHGWLQRVFLGSVSQHVLHHAHCAVMVIRHPENSEQDSNVGT